jgi:hypothetical protein
LVFMVMLSWILLMFLVIVLLGSINVFSHYFLRLCWCSLSLFSWALGIHGHVFLGFIGFFGHAFLGLYWCSCKVVIMFICPSQCNECILM